MNGNKKRNLGALVVVHCHWPVSRHLDWLGVVTMSYLRKSLTSSLWTHCVKYLNLQLFIIIHFLNTTFNYNVCVDVTSSSSMLLCIETRLVNSNLSLSLPTRRVKEGGQDIPLTSVPVRQVDKVGRVPRMGVCNQPCAWSGNNQSGGSSCQVWLVRWWQAKGKLLSKLQTSKHRGGD